MNHPTIKTVITACVVLTLPLGSTAARNLASTFLGGGVNDRIEDLARAPDGGLIVVGTTTSPDFPTTSGVHQEERRGAPLAVTGFVARLEPGLNQYSWVTLLGGAGEDWLSAVSVQEDGSIVVAGHSSSRDLPITGDSWQESHAGGNLDAFVAGLTPDGSSITFATYLGGEGHDEARDMVLDTNGQILVTGITTSLSFPVTESAHQTERSALHSAHDGFVTRLDPSGSRVLASTYLGGDFSTTIEAIALGPDGSIHVAGTGRSRNFPTTAGAYREVHGPSVEGNSDAFVTRMDPFVTQLCYSTYLGGGRSVVASLAVDAAGRAVVGGTGTSPWGIDQQGFLGRLAADGSSLDWAEWFGSNHADAILDIGLDEACRIYVVGGAHSSSYPFDDAAIGDVTVATDSAALMAVFDSSGRLQAADLLTGGVSTDLATGVHVDGSGRFVVAGASVDPSYPTHEGAAQEESRGFLEAFVTEVGIALAEGASVDGCGSFETETCGRVIVVDGETAARHDRVRREGTRPGLRQRYGLRSESRQAGRDRR